MTDRSILRLPSPRPTRRKPGSPARAPRPKGAEFRQQGQRFNHEFERLQSALDREDAAVELRRDPFGIAPERALVFVTAVSISDFARAARLVNLEIISEIELEDDYQFPDDRFDEFQSSTSPTLYATMPTQDALDQILRLWRKFQANESAEHGYTPWFNLFKMLVELRTWGHEDRLSADNRTELENRLPSDDHEEVRLELEYWPTQNQDKLSQWKRETEEKVLALRGRIIDRSAIQEEHFNYNAILVGLAAGTVRNLIDNPSAPKGLATLDGLQFILPQTIAQSLPSHSNLNNSGRGNLDDFDPESPYRALLFDSTPIAGHQIINGGVAIEDVHNLVDRSIVDTRRHATEMASLILRGDLDTDGHPVRDSRILAIPLLIDAEFGAISPDDRLFVDLVHTALQRALLGNEPLAPEAFVVNFSIGVRGSNFAGRISSLARLLDWWSSKEGVLFVVSAGNIHHDLEIPDITSIEFEGLSLPERQSLVRKAQRKQRYDRTLLSPSEALNALTVGAASLDLNPHRKNVASNTVEIHSDGDPQPAISSATGLGPFRTIKPDLISIGGYHEVRALQVGKKLQLRTVSPSVRSGLTVATAKSHLGDSTESKSRGTSCAAALVTRSLLNAAAALTEEGGPYEGLELSCMELALLTRALAINASRWPDAAIDMYVAEQSAPGMRGRHSVAAEDVARYFGYGYLDTELMSEAPLHGVTLVGLGQIRKDEGMIFDMPLPPSLSGDSVHRTMLVTISWFSPIEPARAKYRLVALEAIAADDNEYEDEDKDRNWRLAMKGEPPFENLIKRGTVWSRRLIHDRVSTPKFDDGAMLPIRVQCRDATGGGLSPDLNIPFAIAVTLQVSDTATYDVREQIRDQLLIRLHSGQQI